MKFFMLFMMSTSLLIMFFTGVPQRGIIYTGTFMAFVAIWAWRYPSSVGEHDNRIANGKKIGWFNNSF
jgi:hypothetical protein